MNESSPERGVKPRDRKLGDEWADWKGDRSPGDSEINEPLFTFSTLAAAVILLSICLLALGWYLIKPRIVQISPPLSVFIEKSVIFLAGAALLLTLLEGISVLKFRKSLFPYGLMEKFLLALLPIAVWLGAKFGISRDKVGNSFIKVHNFLTRSHADRLNADRLLILLPRCLKKEARSRLMEKADGNAVKVLTVAGGEEAREAIREYRPTLILALACERDLMSGIKDVAERVPVLAIPNKRPEGPCKNTDFSSEELEETLAFITEQRKKNQ